MFGIIRRIIDKKVAITTGFAAAMSMFSACTEEAYGCPSMLERPYDAYRDKSIEEYNKFVDCCGLENIEKITCGLGTTGNCVHSLEFDNVCTNTNVELKLECCGSFEMFNRSSVDDLTKAESEAWRACRAQVDKTGKCSQ